MDPINYLGAMGGLQGISNPGGAFLNGMQAGEDRLAQQEVMALQRRLAEQKLLDQQRAAQREQQYQQMVQQFMRNPSAQAAADLQILFPDKREAIKSAWDTQNEEVREANLRQLGGVFSALSGDRPDLAKKALQERISAEKEAGRPTGEYEALIDMIEKDPQQARGFAGFLLASVVGPEKYAAVTEQLRLAQKGGEDFTLAPGSVRYDAEGNVVASSPYRPEIIRDPETGAVYQFTPEGGDPASGGAGSVAPRGIPQAAIDYLRQNPNLAPQFDRKYGSGASKRYLGGAPSQGGATFRPVTDAGAIARSVYPGIQITQVGRDPNSPLGRANPGSWHNGSRAAIDVRPIPGMSFGQYLDGYRKRGLRIIEARDEVKNPSKHATGPHWHVVLGE